MPHSCIYFPQTGSNSCAPAHISPSRHYPCPPTNISLSPFGPFVRLGLSIRPTLLNAFFPSLPPLAQVSLSAFQWDFKDISHVSLLQPTSPEFFSPFKHCPFPYTNPGCLRVGCSPWSLPWDLQTSPPSHTSERSVSGCRREGRRQDPPTAFACCRKEGVHVAPQEPYRDGVGCFGKQGGHAAKIQNC